MKQFNKIAIIGVGLIGGSIGLAVKRKRIAKEVVGICRRRVSARAALKVGSVDAATLNYREGLEGADFVIIATPVGKIIDIARKVIKYANNDIVLTDVGSTKKVIVKEIEKIVPPYVKFVGSHPMAGSEKRGVEAAYGGLFKKSICIVTKTKKTNEKALDAVRRFWEKVGACCKILSPAKHDYYISFVSHLPHVAASALTVAAEPNSLRYASTGFKDTTRIAASDPFLWKDIFMTNKDALMDSLYEYRKALERIETSIKRGNLKSLTDILKRSKEIRDRLK